MNERTTWRLLALLVTLVALGGCAASQVSPPAPTPTRQATPQPLLTATVTAAPTTEQASSPPETAITNQPAQERIIYLDPDGKTVQSVRPDGSDTKTLFSISKDAAEIVTYLAADPTGSYVLYGLSEEPYSFVAHYFVAHGGQTKPLPGVELAGDLRWSPDGRRITGRTYLNSADPSHIFIYDLGGPDAQVLDPVGRPDWYSDGERMVYVLRDDVFSYDLKTNDVAQLTKLPHDEDKDSWVVQEAHVLYNGRVIFFGGPFKKDGELILGASGNGQQWWFIPNSGGEPVPWVEPEGNRITAFTISPDGRHVAYAGSAHYNACAGVETVAVVDTGGKQAQPIYPTIPELDEQSERFIYINNVVWSPDSNKLAFGIMPYSCADAGAEASLEKPVIYIWDSEQDGAPATARLLNGSLPVWTRESSK